MQKLKPKFHTNLVGNNKPENNKLEAKKKDFIENKPKEDSGQALVSKIKGDKWIRVSEDISLSRLLVS